MTFDNFNAGKLAFGKKITSAFNTLDELLNATVNRVNDITKNTEYYLQFVNNNYSAPKPTKPTMPVRTDEFLDILDQQNNIRTLNWDGTNFNVSMVVFNKATQRCTSLTGSTTIKEGYAIALLSQSLTNLEVDIRFSENEDPTNTETVLFQYRIDDNGYVHIIDSQDYFGCYPYDDSHYYDIQVGESLSVPYTSSDYECVIGTVPNADEAWKNVYLNGNLIYGHQRCRQVREQHFILYLKPNDKITGDVLRLYKVKYVR